VDIFYGEEMFKEKSVKPNSPGKKQMKTLLIGIRLILMTKKEPGK